MASNASSARPTFQSILQTPYTYVVTIVLMLAAVIGAYVVSGVHTFVAYVGLAAGFLGLATFLAQDLQSEATPSGWPSWTTFAVIVVVGGLEAGVGQVTGTTFLSLAGIAGIVLFVAQWVINALNQDEGTNIPIGTEMQIVALLGILITALSSLGGSSVASASIDPTNAATGLTVTTFAALGGYVFARERRAAKIRGQRAAPPAPVD